MRASSTVSEEVHIVVASLFFTILSLDETVLTHLRQQWNPLVAVAREYVHTILEYAASRTPNDILSSHGADLERIKERHQARQLEHLAQPRPPGLRNQLAWAAAEQLMEFRGDAVKLYSVSSHDPYIAPAVPVNDEATASHKYKSRVSHDLRVRCDDEVLRLSAEDTPNRQR
jgi:hypothetical protein